MTPLSTLDALEAAEAERERLGHVVEDFADQLRGLRSKLKAAEAEIERLKKEIAHE